MAAPEKKGYFSEYGNLKHLPLFFWGVIIYNFFDILAYTFVIQSYFPFFTKNVGMSGTTAGTWFFGISWIITACAMLGGVLIDRLGPKKTYIFTIFLAGGFRFLATLMYDFPIVSMILHGASLCMVAMSGVVCYVLLKRFSNRKTSILVFSFQYLTMNLAFTIAGIFYDFVRELGTTLEGGLEIVMYASVIFYTTAGLIMLFFINDKKSINEEFKVIPYKPEISESEQKSTFSYMKMTFFEKAFWVYVAIMVITAMAKFIFSIPHYTLPNVMINTIDPQAKIGLIGAINPFLITIGIITLTPLVMKIRTPNALLIGTAISGSSLLMYFISPVWMGETLNNLFGLSMPTIAFGFYALIVVQMIIYPAGELIWSPRLSEFGMRIAPKGKEGIYGSLVLIPLLITKFFMPLNGYLLDTYCPNSTVAPNMMAGMDYLDQPSMIFIVFWAMLMITPISLFFFRGYVQKRIDEADDRHRKSIEEAEKMAEENRKNGNEDGVSDVSGSEPATEPSN